DGDLALLARLEPHRGAGGNVEVSPERFGPAELQCRVHIEEVKVRPNLNRTVTGIPDQEHGTLAPGEQLYLTLGRYHLPGLHAVHRLASRTNRIVDRHELLDRKS